MLYETTPRQKESYLRFFEGYEEDEAEAYVEPKDAIEKGAIDSIETEKNKSAGKEKNKNSATSTSPPTRNNKQPQTTKETRDRNTQQKTTWQKP